MAFRFRIALGLKCRSSSFDWKHLSLIWCACLEPSYLSTKELVSYGSPLSRLPCWASSRDTHSNHPVSHLTSFNMKASPSDLLTETPLLTAPVSLSYWTRYSITCRFIKIFNFEIREIWLSSTPHIPTFIPASSLSQPILLMHRLVISED